MTTIAITAAGDAVDTVDAHSVIRLTARVRAGSAAVTIGQVKFCDATATFCEDSHLLATSQLTADGSASFKFVPGPGSHSYNAVFIGTNTKGASASTASPLTVTGKYPTATSIAGSGSAGSYTLSSTVTGGAAGVTPTAEVYFLDTSDANFELGKASLAGASPGVNWVAFYPPLDSSDPVAAGDFNNDGFVDLVTISNLSIFVQANLGDGRGNFPEHLLTKTTGAQYVGAFSVADFNSDGVLDLAVVNGGMGPNAIDILLGQGDGRFTPLSTTIQKSGYRLTNPKTGDFNGDGIVDLAVSFGSSDAAGTQFFLGSGDGTFTPAGTIPEGISLVGGDFDGDGKTDIVLQSLKELVVRFGNGDGTFTDPVKAAYGEPYPPVIADFNGDGRSDLATSLVATQGGTVAAIVLGNADRTFTRKGAPPLKPGYFGTGDFNGDGIADLVNLGSLPRLVLGHGDGSFSRTTITYPKNFTARALISSDFNGDGLSDIVFSSVPSSGVLLTQLTSTVSLSGKAPQGSGSHEVVAKYYHADEYFIRSTSPAISLTGLTGSAAIATFSRLAVPFSSETVGDVSNAKTIVLTNTGTAPLLLGSFTLMYAPHKQASFATSNNCPASLAIGAACKLRFRFAPSSPGAKMTQLVVADSAGNSPQTIVLTGTGVNAP